jgi:hypothetical protein
VEPAVFGHIKYTILKFVANTRTELITHASQTMATSDVVYLEANGTTLTLKVNGTQILQTTDSDIASGQVGLYASQAAGTIENWDTFEAGDLSTGGPSPLVGSATLTGTQSVLNSGIPTRSMIQGT